jgi:hypothetical protein
MSTPLAAQYGRSNMAEGLYRADESFEAGREAPAKNMMPVPSPGLPTRLGHRRAAIRYENPILTRE